MDDDLKMTVSLWDHIIDMVILDIDMDIWPLCRLHHTRRAI